MLSSGDDDNTIREYLLGRLSEAEREEFAQRLFMDEELLDRFETAEEDLIDDFLIGNLSPDDVAMFHQHFLVGSKRQRALQIGKSWRNYAAAHLGEKAPKPEPGPSWWQRISPYANGTGPAAAFSSPVLKIGTLAALLVITALVVWIISRPSEVDKGLYALNAAYQQERPLQSRITALDYAPYSPTTRGSSSINVNQNELRLAEATLQQAVISSSTPQAHHALGKVLLAKKEFDEAIKQFEEAVKGNPNDAQIYSDLGTALLEQGKLEIERAKTDTESDESGKGVEYFARSLENLNKALQLDSNLLEALYNRALLHESMSLLPQAEADWRKYLEKDPNSKWAGEARERLAKIEEQRKKTSESGEEIFERFLSQINSGDEEGAWATVSGFQNRSGNVVVEQLIDSYLEALAHNKKDNVNHARQLLAYVGQLQLRKSEDRFFFDLARFYESADVKQRELVLQARELMKKGHAGWGTLGIDENLSLFENARELFEKAGDYPEALVAEYWISFCHYRKPGKQQSTQILDPLFFAFEKRNYSWLQARAFYLLSSMEFDANEHSKAVDAGLRSAQIAKRINDSVGLLNATTSLIAYYGYLGSYAESRAWIQRSLPLTRSSLDPVQGNRHYTWVAHFFATTSLHDAAIGYQREALRFALNTDKDLIKSQSYAFLGAIQGKLENFDEALTNVQLAFDLARANQDSRLMAYSALQMGNIYKDAKEFDKAVVRYTESINLYEPFPKLRTYLYQAHKGRFLSYLQQQNDRLTQTEILTLFDLINKYRRQISDENHRNTFFDVEQTVVDAAIDFEYSRMDNPEQAFNYSNSSRARSLFDLLNADADVKAKVQDAEIKFKAVTEPRSLEEIKQQLPEQTQLVQYVVLEDKLLIYVISRNNFQVKMQPVSRKDLNEKLLRFLNIISRPPKDDGSEEQLLAKELYAILIQPVEALLDKRKLLCIVPDGTLSYLPFAALVSSESGKYLFEDHLLMTSPSPSVFLSCSENASQKIAPENEKVLSVGNPTFDRTAFPDLKDLPEAVREAVAVGKLYKLSVPLTEKVATRAAVMRDIESSEVIHLALHSRVDDEVPLRSRLLLAKTKTDSVVYAHEIYNLRLSRARLVVLSSCESGAGRYYGGEGVSSLARAFISAGAPLVVASLWPVESTATEMLMVNFHSHRTEQRLSTAKALGKAQQQMARGSAENLRRPYYWAAFTVTGGYAEF